MERHSITHCVTDVFFLQGDPTLNFFYQPHTVSILMSLLLFGLYIAVFEGDEETEIVNIKRGLIAVVVVFIIMGSVLLRDGPFSRPHPVVWRVVLAVSILYELFLVFLLFLVTAPPLLISHSHGR